MWDLRSRGVRILSTDASDLDALSDPGPSRLFIRDVLTRVGEHAALVGTTPETPREDTDDVGIQLVTDPSDVATEG